MCDRSTSRSMMAPIIRMCRLRIALARGSDKRALKKLPDCDRTFVFAVGSALEMTIVGDDVNSTVSALQRCRHELSSTVVQVLLSVPDNAAEQVCDTGWGDLA